MDDDTLECLACVMVLMFTLTFLLPSLLVIGSRRDKLRAVKSERATRAPLAIPSSDGSKARSVWPLYNSERGMEANRIPSLSAEASTGLMGGESI